MQAFTLAGSSISFLLVFRSQISYNRFWEGKGWQHLGRLREGDQGDIAASALARALLCSAVACLPAAAERAGTVLACDWQGVGIWVR